MAPALTSFLTRRDSELDQSINQLVLYLDRQTIDTCNYNCNSNYIRQSKLMWSCEQEMIYYKSIIIITVNRHKTFKTTFEDQKSIKIRLNTTKSLIVFV